MIPKEHNRLAKVGFPFAVARNRRLLPAGGLVPALRIVAFWLAWLGLGLAAGVTAAAGEVQLEVVGGTGSPLVYQEWLKALSGAGIRNVRIRSAQPADRPAIDVRGTAERPVYLVTGVLGAGDEIVLPGGRFRRSEVRRLAEWLDDLAKRGPPESRPARSAFGLTDKQLEAVHDDLARPLEFSTAGVGRAEALQKIAGRLKVPLRIEGELPGDEKIEEELSGVSAGTALACILRPVGFALVPQESGGGLAYRVASAKLDQEVWPIGWPPKRVHEALPGLYELRNVNVSGVSAAKVLEAVGRQLHVPVLLDHNALARHGIDPAQAAVWHPQTRTSYSVALRKILYQAGLKFEVRVDEAGHPLLWISTLKPV